MRISIAVICILAGQAVTLADPVIDDPVPPPPVRDGVLLEPAPWPTNRVDQPDRPQNGRLWISRSPIGTRTPIPERVLDQPGPASFGAPVDAAGELIFVQTRYPLPPIAISPWDTIDESTVDHLTRRRPWIRDTTSVVEDLRLAQQQWLKEQGFIKSVRTHVNPRLLETRNVLEPYPNSHGHESSSMWIRQSQPRFTGQESSGSGAESGTAPDHDLATPHEFVRVRTIVPEPTDESSPDHSSSPSAVPSDDCVVSDHVANDAPGEARSPR